MFGGRDAEEKRKVDLEVNRIRTGESAYDVRGGIWENEKLYAGQKKISEMAKDAIADSSYNWVEKVNNGEVTSNIIIPYVQLYELLKEEIRILELYKDYIAKIESE